MTAEKSGEFRGKTVEAAVSAGLAALKLSLDDVTVEIVRPGSRGVLGIGAEDAVVRLTPVQAGKPEPRSLLQNLSPGLNRKLTLRHDLLRSPGPSPSPRP